MIKRLLYLILPVIVVACTTEYDRSLNEMRAVACEDGITFYATLEGRSEVETKVFADERMRVLWNADDRITVFNKNTFGDEYRFTGEDGANAGVFQKVPNSDPVTGNTIDFIYAVYPHLAGTSIDNDGVLDVTLPATQYYKADSFGIGANTMVSVTDDNQLRFKNVGGYLSFKFYGDNISVKSVAFKGNNGEKLAGRAKVSMTAGGTPTVEMQEGATESVTLTCETPVMAGASADNPTEFWLVLPPTVFTKGFTVTVTDSQGGIFEKSTSGSVTISRNNLSRMSPMEIVTGSPQPQAVDLGLPSGTKWASFNLGATTPEQAGYYYAWGETEPKDDFTWATYKWCDGSETKLTKYNSDSAYGVVDNKTALEPEDDAAYLAYGGAWHIPTNSEMSELISKCTWEWTTVNGVEGYEVVSKSNGNSIFIPVTGRRIGKGIYDPDTEVSFWTATPSTAPNISILFARSSSVGSGSFPRYFGFPIRPVCGVSVPVTGISIDTEAQIRVGIPYALTATVTPADATDAKIVWTSSEQGIAVVSGTGVVTGISEGSATIRASCNGCVAECRVTVYPLTYETPEAVDLDLPSGLLWGSFNLGAVSPEESGVFLAWGETEPKAMYDWETNKWYDKNSRKYMKYTEDDGLVTLGLEDDAANVHLGGNWRMPSKAEVAELMDSDNCSWNWAQINGVSGYRIVSKKNGNSIFLPRCGYRLDAELYSPDCNGEYWTSTLTEDNKDDAEHLWFRADNKNIYSYGRYGGLNIRPVSDPNQGPVFEVSPLEVNIAGSEQTFTVKVKSNMEYHVEIANGGTWISKGEVTHVGIIHTHTFTVSKNTDQERTGVITFCASDNTCHGVTVRQSLYSDDWTYKTFTHHSLGMRFTATWCGYCPRMNKAFIAVKQELGDRFNYVTLHTGSSSLAFDGTSALESQYNITGYPTGIIDGRRTVSNSSMETTKNSIIDYVNETENNYPSVTAASIRSTLNGNSLSVTVEVYAKLAESYKITVVLLESGIIASQVDYDENTTHEDYVHDKVARKALTSISGDTFTTDQAGTVKTFNYNTSIPVGCNADNMSILVWVQRQWGGQAVLRTADFGNYYVDNSREASLGITAALEAQ